MIESSPPASNAEIPKSFVFFLIGVFVSQAGAFMQVVAEGWLVAELSHDPFWLGFVGFCGGVPWLAFSLLGGGIADRISRKVLVFGCQFGLMVVAAILALLTYLNMIAIWQVALLSFFTGFFGAINGPAYHAFIFDVVGHVALPKAVSLNATAMHLSRMVGPAIGGVVIAWAGAWGCFALNAATFLAILPVVFFIPIVVPQDFSKKFEDSLLSSLVEAYTYVRSIPLLALTLGLTALTTVCIFPHIQLLPLFVKKFLNEDSKVLGIFWAFSAVGSVTATLVIGRFSGIVKNRGPKTLLLTSSLSAVFLILMSYTRVVGVVAILMMAIGFCFSFSALSSQSILQFHVDSKFRGRVMGMWNMLFQGMFPVGAFLVGTLAQWITIPHAWAVSSLCLLITLLSLRVWLRMRLPTY